MLDWKPVRRELLGWRTLSGYANFGPVTVIREKRRLRGMARRLRPLAINAAAMEKIGHGPDIDHGVT
ncbi:hypothetical protein PLANPX_0622 [Lacipirellula parvula]|uniref:Uncharacterized protein n=1 Tax=Lacipirellula parvula TaxID=2650471 RepID=A0A5K7X3D3_9BACT|nr:hypothetical protein PLANPX_0622 [Lacipirellula parvula]